MGSDWNWWADRRKDRGELGGSEEDGAGGEGYRENESGYRENKQGSEENIWGEDDSMSMGRFIVEELWDDARWAWGRMMCRYLKRHGPSCRGSDCDSWRGVGDDGNAR